jgi:hypothetical protein
MDPFAAKGMIRLANLEETHLQALSYVRRCNSFWLSPAHSMHAAAQQQETG